MMTYDDLITLRIFDLGLVYQLFFFNWWRVDGRWTDLSTYVFSISEVCLDSFGAYSRQTGGCKVLKVLLLSGDLEKG